MVRFDRVDKILDFAISRELQSYRFYTDLAGKTKDSELRRILEELAQEELCHKGRLEAVKEGNLELFREKGVDIQFDDHCVEIGPAILIDSQDAISLATRREQESIRLYKMLASTVDWGGLRQTFLLLAQEEAEHKSKFEEEG